MELASRVEAAEVQGEARCAIYLAEAAHRAFEVDADARVAGGSLHDGGGHKLTRLVPEALHSVRLDLDLEAGDRSSREQVGSGPGGGLWRRREGPSTLKAPGKMRGFPE